jgi:hypothetical protein
MKLEFSFPKYPQIANFMKILPVVADLFHAEGRTDRHVEAASCKTQNMKLKIPEELIGKA